VIEMTTGVALLTLCAVVLWALMLRDIAAELREHR